MITKIESVGPFKTVVHTKSNITGNPGTVTINKSKVQVEKLLASDTLVQEAFPELSPEDREMLITGINPVEWCTIFK